MMHRTETGGLRAANIFTLQHCRGVDYAGHWLAQCGHLSALAISSDAPAPREGKSNRLTRTRPRRVENHYQDIGIDYFAGARVCFRRPGAERFDLKGSC